MTTNISARNFSLTINGIDRKANFLSLSLSQDELGDKAVLIKGTITLKANYSQRTDFTYMASPAIAANWARGVQVVYRIANDSGALTNHLLSGARLFILQEPAPPDPDGQITLQIGDEATLKNYRTAVVDASGIVNVTGDPSGILEGTVTPRDTVVKNYLTAAGITHSISSIPYPFRYSQPQLANGTLVDTAGKMARSANHILYTNSAGTLVNRAIDLSVSAIASFTIGSDEKLFDYVDSSGIETTVDELVISGLTTEVEDQSFPVTSVAETGSTYTDINLNLITGAVLGLRYIPYISTQTTVSNYGWNGVYEKFVTVKKAALIANLLTLGDALTGDPRAALQPSSGETIYKFYDEKSRLTKEVREVDIYFNDPKIINDSRGVRIVYTNRKFGKQDIVTTYTYDDKSVITGIREETTNYSYWIDAGGAVYGRTAKEQSWGSGFYSIQNFYQSSSVSVVNDLRSFRLVNTLSDWFAGDTDTIYARDSSIKPPQTTYRKPFTTSERQINVKLRAKPFAGDSLKERSRPVDVDFLVSEAQATDYGNVFLALLYGRKQSFTFATAINDNLLANLKPLARIDITWYGVVYQCLVDGISWAHTLTEMVIGMRLIPLRTALAATPSTTSDLVIPSPIIQVNLLQDSFMGCQLITDNYLGGIGLQDSYMSVSLVADLAISVRLIQDSEMTVSVDLDIYVRLPQDQYMTITVTVS